MVSFVGPFEATPVQPSQVSYIRFTFLESFNLEWPAGLQNTSTPAALWVDLDPQVADLHVSLPDARQVSVGRAVILADNGAVSVDIFANDGSSLTIVLPGVAKYMILIDNTTQAGSWRIVELGAGTSTADAIALAGAGIQAQSNLPNWAPGTLILNSTYTMSLGDRAAFMVWQGGAGTITLPPANEARDRFVCAVTNVGSSTITINGNGSPIDGQATFPLLPGESSMFFCVGNTQWNKLGYGRSLSFSVTSLSKNIPTPGTPYSLVAGEAAAQIHTYTATPALTGPVEVRFGNATNFYLIHNAVTGTFPVTYKGLPADPGVVVANGTHAILINTAGTMTLAVTLTSGTVTSVATTDRSTGGPIVSFGTLDLATLPGVAGNYVAPATISIDTYGRVTAISPTTQTQPPVGAVIDYAGTVEPFMWKFCNGQILNIATYPALLAAMGATYGGNGTTNFALPDLRGRTSVGRDNMGGGAAGRVTAAVSGISGVTLGHAGGSEYLQYHTHPITDVQHNHGITDSQHYHTITDVAHYHALVEGGGHQHAVIDQVHNHVVNDAVHGHGQSAHGHGGGDSGHAHTGSTDATRLIPSSGVAVGFGSGSQLYGSSVTVDVNYANIHIDANVANIGDSWANIGSTQHSATNIGLTHFQTLSAYGSYAEWKTTGITGTNWTTSNVSVNNQYTGISATQATGSGGSQNMQPSLILNKIIFTGVP